MGSTWIVLLFCSACVFAMASAERSITRMEVARFNVTEDPAQNFLTRVVNFLWQSEDTGYHHVWPVSSSSLLNSWFRSSWRQRHRKFMGFGFVLFLDWESDNFIWPVWFAFACHFDDSLHKCSDSMIGSET